MPPALDGIGDHTARLAAALAEQCAVTVLTATDTAALESSVRVKQALTWRGQWIDASALAKAVAEDRPDALVLQYNPYSYGRWGLNPGLPRAFRAAKRAYPALRLALMVHEPFLPRTSLKNALVGAAQRAQLRALVRQADAVFVSTETWIPKLRPWAQGATPFVHLPVGSNITNANLDRAAARRALGIDNETLVAGVFGTARHTRLLPLVRAASERLRAEQDAFVVLYVGPDGDRMREALPGLPVRDLGRLPEADVSRALTAMDLHLAPFIFGVSTRRGSFMAGLQHGVPTISSIGTHTDRVLAEADGTALLLAPEKEPETYATLASALAADPARRAALAEAAQRLYYDAFAWPLLADRMLATLMPEHAAPAVSP